MGIPYNPQGQAFVERSHAKIKNYLEKIKGNDILGPFGTPYAKLSYILYILNFLLVDKEGKSASDRHWRQSERTNNGFVKWKDLQSGSWKGPDPVLLRLRGSVCVFPKGADGPIWIPKRCVRPVDSHSNQCGTMELSAKSSHADECEP